MNPTPVKPHNLHQGTLSDTKVGLQIHLIVNDQSGSLAPSRKYTNFGNFHEGSIFFSESSALAHAKHSVCVCPQSKCTCEKISCRKPADFFYKLRTAPIAGNTTTLRTTYLGEA